MPTLAGMPNGRTTQGQLVSAIASPSTGPATASTVDRGWTGLCAATLARISEWTGLAFRLVDRAETGNRVTIRIRSHGEMVERFGIDSIRLTGGEPTVRAHLPVLVRMLAGLRVGGDGVPVDLALTTNGATLRNVAHDLVDAGLRRVNVSLDSLRRDRFQRLTRRDELDHVLEGIQAATEAGLDPVKVNVVLVGGVNDDEVAGRIMSISHDRPAHVVIRGGQGMNGHALRVFTVDRIVQVLEGDGR